ncbi:xylose isomerase [Clostridia bacterium]|nr:xylose isomerase [Clostridia bacterium]
MASIFNSIPEIKYEGKDSKNPLSYKFYNPEEKIGGKTMREQTKFALSWWHTLCGDGTDMFGRGTFDKSFGETDPVAIHKAKADNAFEIMNKLGIDYFAFHDRDLAPEGSDFNDSKAKLQELVAYVKDLQKKYGKKLLWGTANCFGNPRYMHGAGTAPNADVFAYAAGQIKNAIDATIELGGGAYVFWGGREGYETLLNTNLGFELDNLARLLHLSADYARSKGFKGDFYIEPKPKEPTKHQYDFDTATVTGFLRQHGLLEKGFKMNIEANHATLAQHTFQHELATARVNGVFGSIDANQGDTLLGWDTDQFPTNLYDTTLCMYEVLKAGGFTNGGLNFDSKTRRGSNTPEDIFLAYIAGIDTFALGLRAAAKLIDDGRIDGFVADRYASYKSGVGKDIVDGKVSLESLEQYASKLGEVNSNISGKQEYLEAVLNQVILTTA